MARHDEPSPSFRDTLEDRLTGLGLIVGGLIGFGIVYLMWSVAPTSMPVPPGMPSNLLPLASPLNCVLPVVAIGSCFLVLLGLRKLLFPEP
jgi:hypothetical protein